MIAVHGRVQRDAEIRRWATFPSAVRYVSVADSGPWTCSATTVTAAFGTMPANRMLAVMSANVSDTARPRWAGIRRR